MNSQVIVQCVKESSEEGMSRHCTNTELHVKSKHQIEGISPILVHKASVRNYICIFYIL